MRSPRMDAFLRAGLVSVELNAFREAMSRPHTLALGMDTCRDRHRVN